MPVIMVLLYPYIHPVPSELDVSLIDDIWPTRLCLGLNLLSLFQILTLCFVEVCTHTWWPSCHIADLTK